MANQFSARSFGNFQYFVGVVEDRRDPKMLGRVKVRCYGIHPDGKENVSTEQLPWATPIMPYTSASVSGVGTSPTGPVEGTWVFGFFMDGAEFRQPMVLGTLVGAPTDPSDPTIGFNDPNGIYPIIQDGEAGTSDVNALARGEKINNIKYTSEYVGRAGEHSLANKRENRQEEVPLATPPRIKTIQNGPPSGRDPIKYWTRNYWNEPNPRYGGQVGGKKDPLNLYDVNHNKAKPEYGGDSKYPLNHVTVTETGHVFEVDDSPGAGRIHQYHNSGTFEEIQPNGTRVTKIVGSDYEIVMCDKNMMVSGNVNITVNNADLSLFVHKDDKDSTGGDMYVEVDGNYSLNVKGNYSQKVQGTKHTEVLSDMATNVNQNHHLRVGGNRRILVGSGKENTGNVNEDIGNNVFKTIKGNEKLDVDKSSFRTTKYSTKIQSLGEITIQTADNIFQQAEGNVYITTDNTIQANADVHIDINAGRGGVAGDVTIDTVNSVKIGNDDKPVLVDINGSEVDIDGDAINLN